MRVPLPDWAALGLSGNPFVNVEPGTHLDWIDWPAALTRAIARTPFLIEVLGRERGEGKSTLLRAVEMQLRTQGRAVGYRYLQPGRRPDLELSHGLEVLLVDEADRADRKTLSQLERWRCSTAGSVILGTHRPLGLGGALEIDLSAERLRGWIERRVASHAVASGRRPDFARWGAQAEAPAKGVNYRILRILYEFAEELARGRAEDEATFQEALRRAEPDLVNP